MSLWMTIVLLLVLIKVPIAALMLWLPFRNDEAMRVTGAADTTDPDASGEDGGSKKLPAGPHGPRPRHPCSGRLHTRARRWSPHSPGRTSHRRAPALSPAHGTRTRGGSRRRTSQRD